MKLLEKVRPFLERNKIIMEKKSGLEDEIEQAHEQWIYARQYFESVSEPELIDHATYLLQAAEKKYMYLMKKARERM